MTANTAQSKTRSKQPQMRFRNFASQVSRRVLPGLSLSLGVACISMLGAAPAQAAGRTVFYGIDNNNNIYEVNPRTKSNNLVNEVGLTNANCGTTPGCLSLSGGANGIAFDTSREQLFFFYRPTSTSTSYDLLTWDRQSTGIGSLQTVRTLSGSSTPANAAYFSDAVWYFGPGQSTVLNKLAFDYTGDTITGSTLTSFNLNDYAAPNYPASFFGDIAINPNTGLLYGSTNNGNFYSIDLTKLDDTTNAVYTDLGTINTLQGSTPGAATLTPSGLQLSFNTDYSKLYGTRFCNTADNCNGYTVNGQPIAPAAGDGLFFEIPNFASGDSTTVRNLNDPDLLFFDEPGFRDLGGATRSPIEPVPGPLPVIGAGVAFGWSRRLRKRLKSSVKG
jgi:hypothetical protein